MEITDQLVCFDGDVKVVVEIHNTKVRFAWRLVVNDNPSKWYGSGWNLIAHEGYAVAAPYWQGYLPVHRPFKIQSLGVANAKSETGYFDQHVKDD